MKIQQRRETLGFGRAAFELAGPKAQFVQFAVQTLIFSARVSQAYVTAPNSSDVRKSPCSGALERSHQLHGPIADQPHVVFPFDLKREQKYLHKNNDCEQTQRAMA